MAGSADAPTCRSFHVWIEIDTITGMLLAGQPRHRLAAVSSVGKYVQHHPLACADRPAFLVPLDFLFAPYRKTVGLWLLDLDAQLGSSAPDPPRRPRRTCRAWSKGSFWLGTVLPTLRSMPARMPLRPIEDSGSAPAVLRTCTMIFSRCLRVGSFRSSTMPTTGR